MTSARLVLPFCLVTLALALVAGCGRVHLGTHDGGGDRDGGGAREPCGTVLCEVGLVCCNASCNLCAAPDFACPAIACVPGCRTSAECAPGEHCEHPQGTCGEDPSAPGSCVPLPDACPPVLREVCGCDGRTYASSCDAAQMGVSVLFEGRCEPPGSCVRREDCGLLDAYCHRPDGECGAPGECRAIPGEIVACDTFGPPICGCDGRTYACPEEAHQSGTSVLHEGACTSACGPMDATGVGPCAAILGVRWNGTECETIGGCSCTGTDCGRVFATSAECERAYAGCERAPGGECGGFAGFACRPDEWCDFADPHLCGATDESGFCRPRPEVCDTSLEPTCGCDGVGYDNACLAHAAGTDDASDPSVGCGATPPAGP